MNQNGTFKSFEKNFVPEFFNVWKIIPFLPLTVPHLNGLKHETVLAREMRGDLYLVHLSKYVWGKLLMPIVAKTCYVQIHTHCDIYKIERGGVNMMLHNCFLMPRRVI